MRAPRAPLVTLSAEAYVGGGQLNRTLYLSLRFSAHDTRARECFTRIRLRHCARWRKVTAVNWLDFARVHMWAETAGRGGGGAYRADRPTTDMLLLFGVRCLFDLYSNRACETKNQRKKALHRNRTRIDGHKKTHRPQKAIRSGGVPPACCRLLCVVCMWSYVRKTPPFRTGV